MCFYCFHEKKREPPYRGLWQVPTPLAAQSQRERGGPTCTDLQRGFAILYNTTHQRTLRFSRRKLSQNLVLCKSVPIFSSRTRSRAVARRGAERDKASKLRSSAQQKV
jgi:hypothetical protein